METFNFDGSSASTREFGSTTLDATVDITDATPGVTFTVSYQAIYPSNGFLTFATVTISDDAAPGFTISQAGSVSSSISIQTTTPGGMTMLTPMPTNFPTNAQSGFLSFELNTTTNRTAFDTAIAPKLVINGATVTGSVVSGGSTVVFSLSNPSDTLNISSLSVGFTCFCADTRISTPDGPRTIETLSAGDLIRLLDGRDVPVRWIGRQRVDTTLTNPAETNPIRVTRGALGDGMPGRDLRLSPDHAICIDGLLINAGALVNGTTIYQERDVREDFTYYHIETDAHELILAEGVAAETFVDYTTRDRFENAHEAPGRVIDEMPLPRVSSARLVPEHIKTRLRPLIAAE